MVGEKAAGDRSASVPQSHWWRKIHNLNARSRLQEVSGNLNCAERFSALVSCHRGYSSVAFYAVFSLFILTFVYAIWKIVSAHSRSGRRPGSGNSTSVAKLTPTTRAPTYYVSTHTWLQNENVLDHFHQSGKKNPAFGNESPRENPYPAIFISPGNNDRSKIPPVDIPVRAHPVLGNVFPSWTSGERGTNPFYDYYPGLENTAQPPLANPTYPTAPHPSVYNPFSPTAPYPAGFNPYLRLPFTSQNNRQRFQFRPTASSPAPYNVDNLGMFNEKAGMFSSPLANLSYRHPYFLPTSNNLLPQSFYDGNYPSNTRPTVQTSLSPLIGFLKESSNNANTFRHKAKQRRRKRKKLPRTIRKQVKKGRNHSQNHLKDDYLEDIVENNRDNQKNKFSRRRKKSGHHWKTIRNVRKKNHEKSNKNYNFAKKQKPKDRVQHTRPDKRTRIPLGPHGYRHARHHAKKQQHTVHKRPLHPKHLGYHVWNNQHIEKARSHRIPHHHSQRNVRRHRSPLRPHDYRHVRYHAKKQQHTVHNRPLHSKHLSHHVWKNEHIKKARSHQILHDRSQRNMQRRQEANPNKHRKVLDFRLYKKYRKHHSIADEIRGRWNISRHRVRTCKVIDKFSTIGTVKMTRMKEHNRYLHTLLVCRPVRLRIRNRVHRRKYSMKYAQLCSKRWYLTSGIVFVDRSSNNPERPRFKVRICESSYAHTVKLLPAKSKETKIWNISDKFVRKMEREDVRDSNDKSSSHQHELKRHHGHKNVKKHKKWKSRLHKNLTRRKSHPTVKTKRQKVVLSNKSKTLSHNAKHDTLRKHRRKVKKSQNKGKKHKRNETKPTIKKNETISKRKGENGDSDKEFYNKLLKVLKLAKIYDKKNSNGTRTEKIFDSLEAVLTESQNTTKQYAPNKTKHATNTSVQKHMKSGGHTNREVSPKDAQKNQARNKDNIQMLLAKILPVILKSLHNDTEASGKVVTGITTKPTTKVTTKPTKPRTSTFKTTPPNLIASTTIKPNNKSIVEIMKSILPLLLKKAKTANSDSLQSVKPIPKAKPQSAPPKQRSSKKTAKISDLRSLLASLGMGNLASDNIESAILAKGTADTVKTGTKPTRQATPLLQITKPKPLTAVPTMQAPTPLRNAYEFVDKESAMGSQSIPLPAGAQANQQGIPSGPLSASTGTAFSDLLPVSSGKPADQKPTFPSQEIGNNMRPYIPSVNSNPYSRSILCFGDSLTSGYYNHGHSFHPYSQRLGQLLNSDGRLKYFIKTSGKVREMAHGSMAKRLPEVLGNSSRFDWVIILGGTNDVAHVKNFGDDDSFMNQLISVWKPRIVRDIEVLHEISHNYGARTVLLTIPETAYEAWPNFKTLWVMRNRINQDLREYARRSQGKTVLCDLAAKLPRHSLSLQAQAMLWNDHLHLTAYGYDRMAEIVYQCLKPYLSK